MDEDKVEIKSVAKSNFLHGKMYYIERDGGEDAILGQLKLYGARFRVE